MCVTKTLRVCWIEYKIMLLLVDLDGTWECKRKHGNEEQMTRKEREESTAYHSWIFLCRG